MNKTKRLIVVYGLDCLVLVSDLGSSFCSSLILFVLNHENYILFCM